MHADWTTHGLDFPPTSHLTDEPTRRYSGGKMDKW